MHQSPSAPYLYLYPERVQYVSIYEQKGVTHISVNTFYAILTPKYNFIYFKKDKFTEFNKKLSLSYDARYRDGKRLAQLVG